MKRFLIQIETYLNLVLKVVSSDCVMSIIVMIFISGKEKQYNIYY